MDSRLFYRYAFNKSLSLAARYCWRVFCPSDIRDGIDYVRAYDGKVTDDTGWRIG